MRTPHIALFAIALGVGCTSRGAVADGAALPSNDAVADSLARIADAGAPQWLATHKVPSVAIAYIRNGRVAWTRAYGEQGPGAPATPRTLYNVASLTKPVFAETMVRLAAAGRISLDEPLSSYWVDPDVASDPRNRALTPRIALSHRAGFPNWRTDRGGVLRFEFDPGTRYQYSGEGFEYLRRFAERKLGVPIDSLAREYVFTPFGMRNTSFVRQPWFDGRVALPSSADGKWGNLRYADGGNAADLLYTTVGDYAAFVVGVMNRKGLPDDFARQRDSIHAVDSSEVVSCTAKKGPRCPTREGYGLGWSILEFPDGRMLWHTGSDDGQKTIAFYFPDRKEGAVFFMNGDNGFQVAIDAGIALFSRTAFADFLRTSRQ
jgi:CubicO group peptidase (beta-lactamase class C family)